ncbi:MAG: cytochrome oxidase subunit III [Gemmatimonadales bacterium]|nr:MAG: cytochrome oxidase subunit III [Gemmatimonadales bacterium]
MAQAAVAGEHATNTGISNWKVGFWTFLASECLFFGTLISTYMVYKGTALVGPYPEEIFSVITTTVSTTVLLFSSLAMVLALDQVQKANKKAAIGWLFAVIAMGGIFLVMEFQSYLKYIDYGLTLTSSTFGSSYYVLTGTHKVHVLFGMIWMGILAWRLHKDRIPPAKSEQVEIAGLYWHFVDIIWIVIFTLVYLIP